MKGDFVVQLVVRIEAMMSEVVSLIAGIVLSCWFCGFKKVV